MIEFTVTIPHDEETAIRIGELLKKFFNFEIFDLRESDILRVEDDSKVCEVFLIYCRGEIVKYEMFKKLYNLKEKEYEGRPVVLL